MLNDFSARYYQQTADWMADKIADGITDEYKHLTPSQWAEERRMLPRSVTPKPGPFSFDDTPYWKEVVDRLDPNDPARFIAVQKGAQVAATTGVLENAFGYLVDFIRAAPGMFATADDGLTKLRIDQYMIPMLQHSDLAHLIQSNDAINKRKQGSTGARMEWAGGGFLIPIGAQSANKMRSFSVQYLFRDEISGWPLQVGRDADPLKLTETRTDSFELTRKILDLSTPNKKATDTISRRFQLGDQRYFYVPCKHCGEMQVLRFRHEDGGSHSGLHWDHEATDHGRRITPGSVRYVCPFCGGEMINEDKSLIMSEGEWRPTATASRPGFYSYHISALYAPWYAKSWEACALDWFDAWDDEANRPKDMEKLQVFYNNVLGEPFEEQSDRVEKQHVSPHRRDCYRMGQVPNDHAARYAGGPVRHLTMAADVQKEWIALAVFGWAPSYDRSGCNPYLVHYEEVKGSTESADGPAFTALADRIDNLEFGGIRPLLTMVDAGYRTDQVYAFCAQWDAGVFPLRGRDAPIRGARFREFSIQESDRGYRYAAVTVDIYKDRWSAALRRSWNGVDRMPRWLFSMPVDVSEDVIKHLTVEYKVERKDPKTGKRLGSEWHRPGGSRQELWDLAIYATAAFEMFVHETCINEIGVDALVWGDFWAWVDHTHPAG